MLSRFVDQKPASLCLFTPTPEPTKKFEAVTPERPAETVPISKTIEEPRKQRLTSIGELLSAYGQQKLGTQYCRQKAEYVSLGTCKCSSCEVDKLMSTDEVLNRIVKAVKAGPDYYVDLVTLAILKVTNPQEVKDFCVPKHRLYCLDPTALEVFINDVLEPGFESDTAEFDPRALAKTLNDNLVITTKTGFATGAVAGGISRPGTPMLLVDYAVQSEFPRIFSIDDKWNLCVGDYIVFRMSKPEKDSVSTDYIPMSILESMRKFFRTPKTGADHSKMKAPNLKLICEAYNVEYTKVADARVFSDLIKLLGPYPAV